MLTIAAPTAIQLQAKLFRGLADPSRLALLETLRLGPRTVGELVDQTGLSQSNTSNHLSCLLECGLVVREPDGRHARYRLSDPRVDEMLTLAGSLLADFGAAIHACTHVADTPSRVTKREHHHVAAS